MTLQGATDTQREPLVECRNVSVKYRIRHHYALGLKESLIRRGRRLRNRLLRRRDPGRPRVTDFWALKDVTFSLFAGDVVGLIGTNGSGKSTLLRHLSAIEYPDRGEVILRGRVGSLLNLSSGFKPQLSGLENVFLRGAILGLSKAQVQEVLPQVVEFCELGEFLYAPLNTYSAGMKARLGFSIAICIRPDVLLLDEVIGVGDARFKEKAGNVFRYFKSDEQERTILMATHSVELIREHCNKALWLDRGTVRFCGEAEKVIDEYLSYVRLTSDERSTS
jgi:lipopolysaccharide transport system ATP-binding protein